MTAPHLLLPLVDFEHDMYGRYALDHQARGIYTWLVVIIWHAGEAGLPFDLAALARRLELTLEDMTAVWKKIGPFFELREQRVHYPPLDQHRKHVKAFQAIQRARALKRWGT